MGTRGNSFDFIARWTKGIIYYLQYSFPIALNSKSLLTSIVGIMYGNEDKISVISHYSTCTTLERRLKLGETLLTATGQLSAGADGKKRAR